MKYPKGVRRFALCIAALALFATQGLAVAASAPPSETVRLQVDAKATGTPFPHFWEQMFGAGRAALSLRDDYRKDLDAVHQATGFTYVRFHGIFDRDVGL
ncbi:MAG: GH39 family glycosyl hydrolase, partial [Rhodanobacteraceae bacterium]